MTGRPGVYVETAIISYLKARPSRDLIITAQQAMTREWRRDARDRFVRPPGGMRAAGGPDLVKRLLETGAHRSVAYCGVYRCATDCERCTLTP